MITTASVYDKPEEQAGLRVLVMRHWPRGVRRGQLDMWMRHLAPSRILLRAYRAGVITWEQFAERYRAEMEDQQGVLRQVMELERQYGTVTLLCWERHQRCHRFLLKDLLEQLPEG